jgi:GntR family transcriptional regulator, transcriptional repressor for pyruvate dehydrogenase complex
VRCRMALPERRDGALRRNAPEEVADAIRAWMFGRALAPGDRLGREEDLAQRFGVSRPTLREALRLLSSAHLVRATKGPGGGIFVAATPEQGIGLSVTDSVASMLSADSIDLEELIETRMLLEIPLAGLAAQRATEADIATLRAVLEEAGESAQGDLFHGLDRRLHGLIAQIAGNRLARAFTDWIGAVLQPPLQQLVEPAVVDSVVVEQHRDIVRAIERGDPTAAERAMREHLVYLHDLLSAVRRSGEART